MTDCAIVLGKPIHPDGAVPPILVARLERALALYRAGRVAGIIVTGAAVHTHVVEADAMAAWLAERGVPDAAIVRDPDARNTAENGANAARIMAERGWRRGLVIADAAHLRRARLLLRDTPVALAWEPVRLPAGMPLLGFVAHELLEALLYVQTRLLGRTPIVPLKRFRRP